MTIHGQQTNEFITFVAGFLFLFSALSMVVGLSILWAIRKAAGYLNEITGTLGEHQLSLPPEVSGSAGGSGEHQPLLPPEVSGSAAYQSTAAYVADKQAAFSNSKYVAYSLIFVGISFCMFFNCAVANVGGRDLVLALQCGWIICVALFFWLGSRWIGRAMGFSDVDDAMEELGALEDAANKVSEEVDRAKDAAHEANEQLGAAKDTANEASKNLGTLENAAKGVPALWG